MPKATQPAAFSNSISESTCHEVDHKLSVPAPNENKSALSSVPCIEPVSMNPPIEDVETKNQTVTLSVGKDGEAEKIAALSPPKLVTDLALDLDTMHDELKAMEKLEEVSLSTELKQNSEVTPNEISKSDSESDTLEHQSTGGVPLNVPRVTESPVETDIQVASAIFEGTDNASVNSLNLQNDQIFITSDPVKSELHADNEVSFDKEGDLEDDDRHLKEDGKRVLMKQSYIEDIMECKDLPTPDDEQKFDIQVQNPQFLSVMKKKEKSLEMFRGLGANMKGGYALSLHDQLSDKSISSPCLSIKVSSEHDSWRYGDLYPSKPLSDHNSSCSQAVVDESNKTNGEDDEDDEDDLLEGSEAEETIDSETGRRLALIEKSLRALHEARSEDQEKLTLKGDDLGNEIRSCTHSAAQDILEDLKVKLKIKEMVTESMQEVFVRMKIDPTRCQAPSDREPHVMGEKENLGSNAQSSVKNNGKETQFISNAPKEMLDQENIPKYINKALCKSEKPYQQSKEFPEEEVENTSFTEHESTQPFGSECSSEITEDTEVSGTTATVAMQEALHSRTPTGESVYGNGIKFKANIVNNLSKENNNSTVSTGKKVFSPFTEEMNNQSSMKASSSKQQNNSEGSACSTSENNMFLTETITQYSNIINTSSIETMRSNKQHSSSYSQNKRGASTNSKDKTWERDTSSFNAESSLTETRDTILTDKCGRNVDSGKTFSNKSPQSQSESRNTVFTDQFGRNMNLTKSSPESITTQQTDIFQGETDNSFCNQDPLTMTSFFACQGYPNKAFPAVRHYRIEKNHIQSLKNKKRAHNSRNPTVIHSRADNFENIKNSNFNEKEFDDDCVSTKSSLHSCNLCGSLAQENNWLNSKIAKFEKALHEIRRYVHESKRFHYKSCALREENKRLQLSMQLIEEEFQQASSYRSNLEKERSNLKRELTKRMLELEKREEELRNTKTQFKQLYYDKEISEEEARRHIENLEVTITAQRKYFHQVLIDLKRELISICSTHIEISYNVPQ